MWSIALQYLVNSYSVDPYIRWLLDNTRIHILPSMNPDGFEVAREGQCDGGQGRYNARGFDLNRNFPDYFKQNNKRGQPETDAVKEWTSKIQFVLSGGLHGGALVASYPFDNTPNSSESTIVPIITLFKGAHDHFSFFKSLLTVFLNCSRILRNIKDDSVKIQRERKILF